MGDGNGEGVAETRGTASDGVAAGEGDSVGDGLSLGAGDDGFFFPLNVTVKGAVARWTSQPWACSVRSSSA